MPETSLLPPVAMWTIAVAGGISAIAAAWKVALQPVYRKLRAAWRTWERFFEDWNGEPAQAARPGRDAVAERYGVLARLDHQKDTLEEQGKTLELIRHEVFPNNGDSLRDALDAHVRHSEKEHADTRQAIEEIQAERHTIHATAVVKVQPDPDAET